MPIGNMTRKWLIVIIVALILILIGVWIYTGYAAEEVESEVGDEVSLATGFTVEESDRGLAAPPALRPAGSSSAPRHRIGAPAA